jgi:hypothetical protein
MKSFEVHGTRFVKDYNMYDRYAALISIAVGIAIIVVAFVLPLAR